MSDMSIEEDIRRFIAVNITSIPHLECLLLFHRNQNEEWDVKDVARQLYISEKNAMGLLELLSESKFLTIIIRENIPLYKYDPDSPEKIDLVNRLEKAYSINLIPITRMIHAKTEAVSKIQQFADAFKLRKD